MSTKTKWIVGLAAINVAILPFTFAPKRTGARPPADGWLEPCGRLAATALDTPS